MEGRKEMMVSFFVCLFMGKGLTDALDLNWNPILSGTDDHVNDDDDEDDINGRPIVVDDERYYLFLVVLQSVAFIDSSLLFINLVRERGDDQSYLELMIMLMMMMMKMI